MERLTQSLTQSRARGSGIISFLFSFVVHLSLLLILACWAYSSGSVGGVLELAGKVSDSEEVKLELTADVPAEPAETELLQKVSPSDFAYGLNVDIELDALEATAGKDFLAAISASAKSTAFLSDRSKSGKMRGAAFFGAYAEGERFVYVIDSSTSMAGDRWTYACSQLIDSLQQLTADQEFYVISFDVKPSFLFSRGPNLGSYYRNEPKTITKVRAWLKTKILGRGTRPAKALEFALEMKPDAIFLLSDGELQDNTIMQLRRSNREFSSQSPIPIHTVHLFSLAGRETLELIAFENGGSFTPIQGH